MDMTKDKKAKSQCDKILKFMQTHKNGITGLQAYRTALCMCLPQRIYDLQQRGHEIESDYIIVKNAEGKKCRVKQYRLVK